MLVVRPPWPHALFLAAYSMVRRTTSSMGVTIMTCIQTNWEDEENNRCVELDVEFQLVDGRAEISSVTPTQISFSANSPRAGRTLRVWTQTGRALLVRQAVAAGRICELQKDLATEAQVRLRAAVSATATVVEPCPLSA